MAKTGTVTKATKKKATKLANTGGTITARDWHEPSMPIEAPKEWKIPKAKAPKKRKFVDFTFECDNDTLERLNELADLAAVTISQAISVILAMYILDMKEVKSEGFKPHKKVKSTKVK